ncbi:hypothetical protein VTI74DRAFT_8682 [Chaetomium olivicolor]
MLWIGAAAGVAHEESRPVFARNGLQQVSTEAEDRQNERRTLLLPGLCLAGANQQHAEGMRLCSQGFLCLVKSGPSSPMSMPVRAEQCHAAIPKRLGGGGGRSIAIGCWAVGCLASAPGNAAAVYSGDESEPGWKADFSMSSKRVSAVSCNLSVSQKPG